MRWAAGQLYQIEREAAGLPPEERQHLRQTRAKPIADQLHAWLMQQRQRYRTQQRHRQGHRLLSETLGCADTLPVRRADRSTTTGSRTRSGRLRSGGKNWLFAGSQRAGQRAAAIMSLIQSAKLNGHDPHAYLKDVLTRLPTQRASRIGELLPHRWRGQRRRLPENPGYGECGLARHHCRSQAGSAPFHRP